MTCVSEQGASGLLWTVFEGEAFCTRRIASFGNAQEALDWIKAYQERNDHKASEAIVKTLSEERVTLRSALRYVLFSRLPMGDKVSDHIPLPDLERYTKLIS